MRTIDYNTKESTNIATHLAVDEKIRISEGDALAYEEGFATESGVRPETAESGGRIRHPEDKDAALLKSADELLEEESINDFADPIRETESL